jgi:hypothetical protein
VRWLADENFDNDILRGIRRRGARFDVVRVQDIPEISGLDDAALLEWATVNGRVDEILLLDEGSVESDWASGVLYLPLR